MFPATEPTADNATGVYLTLPSSTEPAVESSIFVVALLVPVGRVADGVRLGGAASVEQARTKVVANRAVILRLGESTITILVRVRARLGALRGKRRAMRRCPSRWRVDG
jgi:hypothetical protein